MEEAQKQGLTYVYRLIDTDRWAITVPEVLTAAQAMGFDALNVTFPYKQEVLDHLDELSPAAQRLGAANTVLFKGDRLIGDNTDVYGFGLAVERHLSDAALDSVVQLGAGGAGAAVAEALLGLGVNHLVVVDKEQSRSELLAEALRARFPHSSVLAGNHGRLADALARADGLVHCTPTGMAKRPGLPLDSRLIEPRHWVADIVYRPLETELLVEARDRGCRVLHGGYMAVYQALRTFEMVTGREADPNRMLGHLQNLVTPPSTS
jgi:shikimate dehydrogenase